MIGEWHAIHKAEAEVKHVLWQHYSAGKTGIISEVDVPVRIRANCW